jgi:hypothetical protein
MDEAPGNRSGFGDLTNGEVVQIQSVVDQAGRPLDVVGSAASGTRDPGSDIDYTTAWGPYFHGLENQLPSLQHGILNGAPNPYQGPSIRFEPGSAPAYVPNIP